VPTKIILFVAPINAVMNFLLVWGPEPIRLGFIGAPIATAVSYNLIAILSILYYVYWVPDHSTWHPITRRSFQSLGVICSLGLAGVGEYRTRQDNSISYPCICRSNRQRVVGEWILIFDENPSSVCCSHGSWSAWPQASAFALS